MKLTTTINLLKNADKFSDRWENKFDYIWNSFFDNYDNDEEINFLDILNNLGIHICLQSFGVHIQDIEIAYIVPLSFAIKCSEIVINIFEYEYKYSTDIVKDTVENYLKISNLNKIDRDNCFIAILNSALSGYYYAMDVYRIFGHENVILEEEKQKEILRSLLQDD